jgi:hypothetical protein
MTRSVGLLASYTWSHAINNGDLLGVRQNLYDMRAERGNAFSDLRHRLVVSWMYELPFGNGHRFLAGLPRWGDAILGGWHLSGITNIFSGLPFTPNSAINTLNGSGSQRADRIANGTLPASQRTLDRYFDISAFRTPGPFLFGNGGRYILFGPGTVQFDGSLMKDFRLSESGARRLQFRSEFFNMFNTPQFNNPDANIGSVPAGRITSAGSKLTYQRTSRQIQFALKLYW